MCWSWQVSLIFSILETISIILVGFRAYYGSPNHTEAARKRLLWALPLMSSIALMEWLEVGIWLSDPESYQVFKERDSCLCRPINRAFTTIAAYGISWQGTFSMLFAMKTNSEGESVFRIPLYISTVTTFLLILRFILGDTFGLWTRKIIEACHFSSHCTCTYVGPGGHLLWTFAFSHLEILPTLFTYFLFFNIAMLWYRPFIEGVPYFFSLVVLFHEFHLLGWSTEAYSVWCWSGIFTHAFYLASAYKMSFSVGGLDTIALLVYHVFHSWVVPIIKKPLFFVSWKDSSTVGGGVGVGVESKKIK